MSGLTLLTGSGGFVGRQILKALHAEKVPVRIVVRNRALRPALASFIAESTIQTNNLFTENEDWWRQVCNGVDTIIHAAWYVEPGKYLQSSLNMDCLLGTLTMAKGAAAAKVRRIVGIGTCFEYDMTAGFLSVNTPLMPMTPYAGAKAATFQALSQWLPLVNIEFLWCRLFYLFGEGEDSRRLVPYIRSQLLAGHDAMLSSGTQIRDFMDVADAGQQIALAAMSSRQGPMNICTGNAITIRQLAEKIGDELGRPDLLKFGAREDRPFDPPIVVGVS